MGTNSKIEWTDHTWNPWRGCAKVSPGCDNCYMFRDAKRYGLDAETVTRQGVPAFRAPLVRRGTPHGGASRKRRDYKWADGEKVFVCSWSDFFHPDADQWRSEAWDIIRQRPGLIFQILTKRPERFKKCLPPDWDDGWPNVWLGVTAEDQERAGKRIPILLSTPSANRFASIEPMLEAIDLKHWPACADPIGCDWCDKDCNGNDGFGSGLDWVIVGGESGPGARPMHPDWARSIRDQCQAAGVPFFFKQWGEYGTVSHDMTTGVPIFRMFRDFRHWAQKGNTWVNGGILMDMTGKVCKCGGDLERATYPVVVLHRVGKKAAGCLLDGREWKEFPA